MHRFCLKATLFLTGLSFLYSDSVAHYKLLHHDYTSWFTGPIVATSAYITPPGHFGFEPYVFYNLIGGVYDNHWHYHKAPTLSSINPQFLVGIPFSHYISFQFIPQFFYNFKGSKSYVGMGDLSIGIQVQLYAETTKEPLALMLTLLADAPIGKYKDLDPNLNGVDGVGDGSWYPGIRISLDKLWHFGDVYFLDFRFISSYEFGTPVKVHGQNIFGDGGAPDTKGTIYPGGILIFDTSVQASVSRSWAFVFEALYQHTFTTTFSGHLGVHPNGIIARMTMPSSDQLTFAPAIEYNWDANFGIIGGAWFTYAGRNTPQFVDSTIAINMFF